MAKVKKETIEGNKEAFNFFYGILVAILGSIWVSSMLENAKSVVARDSLSIIAFWSFAFILSSIFFWQWSKIVLKQLGVKKDLWLFNLATSCFVILGIVVMLLAILGFP